MISHKHKSIFIHIPKTAGSSIEKALLRSDGGFRLFRLEDFDHEQIPPHAYGYRGLNQWDPKHMPARYLSPKYAKYKKFCFIRNPWDLMVSCYFWWTQKVKLPIRIKQGEILSKIGFDDFIHSFYTDYINEIHHHGLGQSYWLLGADNKTVIVDYIGRFEKLQEDFNLICDSIGMHRISLEKTNASNHKEYALYYNRYTTQMIKNKFFSDIKRFNYVMLNKSVEKND